MAAYDLFILLDPETPEERRTALVEQVKGQIGSGGATLKGDSDWGMRRLSYEIDHRKEAQYHLFQFEGSREVLAELNRSLSIDDGVLRHRIIRLPGEAPEQTPGPPDEAPRRSSDDRPRDGRERRDHEGGDEVAGEAAPAAPAEAAAPASGEAAPAATAVQDEPAPVEPAAVAPEATPAPDEPVAAEPDPAGDQPS
jgi:small subunit ribosomal protein S6